MAVTQKKMQSNKRFNDKTYERFTIVVRQDCAFRDIVKQAAEACGESVNGFMVKAIRDKVEATGFAFPVPVLPDKPDKE